MFESAATNLLHGRRWIGALAIFLAVLAAAPVSARAAIEITDLKSEMLDGAGNPSTQAGAHPAETVLDFTLSTEKLPSGVIRPTEALRNLKVELPYGFSGNPPAVPSCTVNQADMQMCPRAAQIGLVKISQSVGAFRGEISAPLFNVDTEGKEPALFVFNPGLFGVPSHVTARTDGDFGITYTVTGAPQPTAVTGVRAIVWGVPGASVHDGKRLQFCQRYPDFPAFPESCIPFGEGPGPAEGGTVKPFLSNPTQCDGHPLLTRVGISTWEHPEVEVTKTAESPATTGCDRVEFEPTLKARPTTNVADSPSGLDVDLGLRQDETVEGLATSHLRDAVVTLPEGLVLNPSSANGLSACAPDQIGLTTPVGAGKASFDKAKPTCPASAAIGSVEVDTPALDSPLKGQVYLATPHQNPFGSLLALYLVVEGHGLVVKLAGKVSADPATGRLSTSFDENPQLPVEALHMRLFSGAVAPLRTPAACGVYRTTSVMTPWSAPQSGPSATPKDEYAISRTPTGAPCASSEGGLPKSNTFQAGTVSPIAGIYSPFVLKLNRGDGTQQLTGIDATLPPGLLAKLAGVPYCSDAALATAAANAGAAGQASASCPVASQIGTVTVASGAGPTPFYAPGKAYLAGPYKGAPLSLAVVVPAVAGPFDLGTVVVRNALNVDPTTAQVHAVSDPFPTILQGIPLDLRSIELRLSKPGFTKNPTSCDPATISGAAAFLSGQTSSLSNRFQVGECGRLKFDPKLKLAFAGPTKRTGNPAVRAVLTAREGQANIAGATVILPRSEFIDQAHVNNPCTRVQFAANACPAKSVLGTAIAYSPLLDKPLQGPVYFRSNGGERRLPDIVADLKGQIHVVLVGFIDSVKVGKEGSRVRTRFLSVPDAPVSRFELKLKGGKQGLIENSKNLCKVKPVADVRMTAQNAKATESEVAIATSCKKKAGRHANGKHKGKRG